jgi:hypothetical protein
MLHAATAQAQSSTSDISRQSELLKAADTIQIQSLMARYVALLDADTVGATVEQRVDGFTRLFTSDGIWTEHLWNAGAPTDDGPGCFVHGSAQLARFAEVLFGNVENRPTSTARHNLVTPLIEVSGNSAQAGANWIQTRDATLSDGTVQVIATGRYYLTLQRNNGSWAISKLDLMSDHPLYGTALGPPCTPTGPR